VGEGFGFGGVGGAIVDEDELVGDVEGGDGGFDFLDEQVDVVLFVVGGREDGELDIDEFDVWIVLIVGCVHRGSCGRCELIALAILEC